MAFPQFPRNNIVVTFLGTTSGGGPTETRNCSSLVIDAVGNGKLWMVDCAEGTVRQFALQPHRDSRRVRMSDITKVFITHMHADHTMGVITLLRNVLGIRRADADANPDSERPVRTPRIQIYGPMGIRHFIRTVFNLTHTRSADQYCVHELLLPGENPSAPADDVDVLHPNEEPGTDIRCGEDGFWRGIVQQKMISGRENFLTVDAGPIVHRDPCIGYVIRETINPYPDLEPNEDAPHTVVPRSIVVLGDTSDPSALVPLVQEGRERPVSLLIHEATDAYIPPHIDPNQTTGRNRTEESVWQKAIEKGHSTPAMAGLFAKLIGAERLALNHIGARFPAPPDIPRSGRDKFRRECMAELEAQANRTWKPAHGVSAIAVSDFDRIVIPAPRPISTAAEDLEDAVMDAEHEAVSQEAAEFVQGRSHYNTYGHVHHADPPGRHHQGSHSRGRGGYHGRDDFRDGAKKRENSGGQSRPGQDSRYWKEKKQRRDYDHDHRR